MMIRGTRRRNRHAHGSGRVRVARQNDCGVVVGRRNARGRERALKGFVSNFRRKWTAQTYCIPQYVVQDCGHVQATI